MKKEKPRLLILSDMWGKKRKDWFPSYIAQLEPHFTVDFIDCSELAKIDLPVFEENTLHHEYVRGGIDRAVKALSQETATYDALLAMSIGGVIGWQSLLKGLDAKRFYAVSATRLRYETDKPTCPIQLYYGSEDPFIPDSNWYRSLKIESTVLPLDHEMYYEPELVELVCAQIIDDLKY